MNLSDEPADGEFEAIERLRRRLPSAPPGELWLGDDAAVLADGWLVTVDALVEGLDWDPALSSPTDVGWKAVMVNASDLAAMAATPERLLVALAVPDPALVDALYDGIDEAAHQLGAAVVGGDLSAVPPGAPAVVTVVATGHAPGPVIRRDGAAPGDRLWVSGPLGLAAAGLRMLRAPSAERDERCERAHLRPVAHVSAGHAAARAGVSAMLDVSDGLAADTWHLARASGVAVNLDGGAVGAMARAPGPTVDEVLGGGDDYVLLATAPAGVVVEGWTPIGTCAPGPAAVIIDGVPVEPRGYRHWRRT